MKPYSVDLRERVIAMIQAGELSQSQIAQLFQVSLGTVENWWRRWRKTGDLKPTGYMPDPEPTLNACATTIRTLAQRQPTPRSKNYAMRCMHSIKSKSVRA